MSKLNFLILDCGCENFGQGGTLNHYFSATAKELLTGFGHSVEVNPSRRGMVNSGRS